MTLIASVKKSKIPRLPGNKPARPSVVTTTIKDNNAKNYIFTKLRLIT